MEEKSIESLAEELGRAALKHGARIATAESCTAGGISYALHPFPVRAAGLTVALSLIPNAQRSKCWGFRWA